MALPAAAENPYVAKDKAERERREELKKEALQRLEDCKREKQPIESLIRECYFFTAPRRLRSASASNQQGAGADTRPSDQSELQTSLGREVATDFAEMAISSFTPADAPWAERKPDPTLEDDKRVAVEEAVAKEDDKIFKFIRASNFYPEFGKAAVPDLAIGVVGMLIDDKHPALPIVCQGIPIREIEIGLGPDGRIDDRWIVRNTKYRHVKALLPGVKLPEEVARKVKDNRDAQCQVKWGWWRNWENVGDEEWSHTVLVDSELVHDGTIRGEGSCPFVIGRFGATPDYAWPEGPTIQALEELRYLDEIRCGKIEYVDFTLKSPIAYEDDGVLNFDGGIEPGMAYPKRPSGGRQTIEKIWEPNSIEAVIFEEQELIQRIRRMHYVDFPEQKGKTPPSASQWLDEMVIRQRRIGTPGYAYWREFPFEVFQRFRYLAERRRVVKTQAEIGGGAQLHPYNPAQRAHDNQEVLTAVRLLQIAGSTFPQVMQITVNGVETMKNIQKKLGDKLVVYNTPQEIEQAAQNLSQLAGVFGPRPEGGAIAAAGGGDNG